ncbi:MAG: hypothetical protein CMO81_04765 [Waddliaceae bacterium]|nr:hypothetical protein [Waddliaceae bacterium]
MVLMHSIQAFYSNQVEILFAQLKSQLFTEGSHPFSRRLLVVPSHAMRTWVQFRLAQDPEIKVAMGIEVLFMDQAISTLSDWGTNGEGSRYRKWTQTAPLSLHIEKLIQEALNDPREADLWSAVRRYCYLKGEDTLNRRQQRRLSDLSQHVASLFQQYSLYGGRLLQAWLEKPKNEHWQESLWERLRESSSQIKTFQEYLEGLNLTNTEPSPPIQVYVFAESFMAQTQHQFFLKISEIFPVHYLIFSPCEQFWTDIRSDREARYIERLWVKEGAQEGQRLALEDFLRNRNPILANFGRLGREMALLLEECEANIYPLYLLPSSLLHYDVYEDYIHPDLILENRGRNATILEALQADILFLRNPKESEPLQFEYYDESIQVHQSFTKLRELQNIYEQIVHILDHSSEEENPICPREVLVMAPNIGEYLPFIEAVFASQDSILDYQVLDLHLHSQNHLVQGFSQLLNLVGSRWSINALLDLIEHRAFRKKFSISESDINIFREWIQKSGVRWGSSLEDRDKILEREHCTSTQQERSEVGTWEQGFHLLISSLLFFEEQDSLSIQFSDTNLLGQLIRLVTSLKSDLEMLEKGEEKSLSDWVSYLECLIDAYFSPLDQQDRENFHDLNKLIKSLEHLPEPVKEHFFSFYAIRERLFTLFTQGEFRYRENHVQSVRFCSMLPMRAVPAQVICLIGLNEDDYPRKEQLHSSNMLYGEELADYCPGSHDYDRYLFLEAILSARRSLILSYQNPPALNNNLESPSLLLCELLDYLDDAYRINGDKPSNFAVFRHPLNPFDSRYFDEENKRYPCFSKWRYEMSKAELSENKTSLFFLEDWIESTENKESDSEEEKPLVIDIRDLCAIAKHPLQHFLRMMKIYPDWNDYTDNSEDPFVMDPLTRYFVRQDITRFGVDATWNKAKAFNQVPSSMFGDLTLRMIQGEFQNFERTLKEHHLNIEDIFTVELSEGIEAPILDGRVWRLPALDISQFNCKIIGNMGWGSPKGLLSHKKGDFADLVQHWPRHLLYSQINEIPGEAFSLFLASGKSQRPLEKEQAQSSFEKYLTYYFLCLKKASPASSALLSKCLKGDSRGVYESFQIASKGGRDSFGLDPILQWVFSSADEIPSEEKIHQILLQWQLPLWEAYDLFVQLWAPNLESSRPERKSDARL